MGVCARVCAFTTDHCSGRPELQLPKLVDPADDVGYARALQCEVLTSAALEEHWHPNVPGYVFGRVGLSEEFLPSHAMGERDVSIE